MTPTEFTPFASLAGGAMLGVAAVLLMASHGRIAGISGIAQGLLPPYHGRPGTPGRLALLAGILLAPLLARMITGNWPAMTLTGNATMLVAGGLLVGFGSVLGNGCTSGHGICGMSRLSIRSIVAVAIFMATAMLTVFVSQHLL